MKTVYIRELFLLIFDRISWENIEKVEKLSHTLVDNSKFPIWSV